MCVCTLLYAVHAAVQRSTTLHDAGWHLKSYPAQNACVIKIQLLAPAWLHISSDAAYVAGQQRKK